jgi:hypothetical protein
VDHQIRPESFQERHNEFRRVRAVRRKHQQGNPDNQTHADLQRQFSFSRQPQIPPLGHLRVVVHKSNHRKGEQRKQRQQNEWIRQIGPQQNRHRRREHDQHSAHRRRSRFFLVLLGTFFANVLPDLQFA